MESFSLIIFGVTGNLAQIKLIPALYDLVASNLLPDNFSVIGIARTPMSRPKFHTYLNRVLHQDNPHHRHPIDSTVYHHLCQKCHYLDGNLTDNQLYTNLTTLLKKLHPNGNHNKILYLATYPQLYEGIFAHLKTSHLTQERRGWSRVIIEKPIGTNLASARTLNKILLQYFRENQIYRLDHYLGKETLQNVLTFRFSNNIFEPLINHEYVDHIQITATESFGIGKRGGYYDTVGALKDVGQNHLLQMLALATMNAPKSFATQAITQQRVKLLKSLTPLPKSLILGQYSGYRREDYVAKNSQTDTYFAFKTFISNSRFGKVPIYIRGGKKLTRTATEIAIVFKRKHTLEPNLLIYRLQPNEGIVVKILTKTPGHEKKIEPAYMQFCYKSLNQNLPDPYERLIYDVTRGDQTFFNDAPEIETQWRFIDQLLPKNPQLHPYRSGSWGPKAADQMIAADNRTWLEPSVAFCQF